MHKDLPVLGYLLQQNDGKRLAYITDMNYIGESELNKLRDLDLLVINALRIKKHFSHFSLPESLEIIAQCTPKTAYLIHMSHEMGFHDEVEKNLPPNVHLAYDNLSVNI